MPDTAANRVVWSYPPGQSEGCGTPVIKLGGLIDLGHGGSRDFAHSDLNTSELRAHEKLQDENIGEKEVLIADRLYSGYEVIAGLGERGARFIGRPHQSRKIDFRRGRKIGPDERIVVWKKPPYAPKGSRLESGREFVPQSEKTPRDGGVLDTAQRSPAGLRRPGGAAESILEPFQDKEESGPFPVGQATEGREILAPTPAGFLVSFGRAHAVQENNPPVFRQTKNCKCEQVF